MVFKRVAGKLEYCGQIAEIRDDSYGCGFMIVTTTGRRMVPSLYAWRQGWWCFVCPD